MFVFEVIGAVLIALFFAALVDVKPGEEHP